MNISISKGVEAGTGLEAKSFEIRAKSDISINVDDTFNINGFIGGLIGSDAADNIRIKTGSGNLNIEGSMIKATNDIVLQSNNINSDLSSVFIAKDLNAKANGSIKLNTMIDKLVVDSLVDGDITIYEADDLTIERADAHNGFIKVIVGGDITAKLVRTHVDSAANDITLKAVGSVITKYNVNVDGSIQVKDAVIDATIFNSEDGQGPVITERNKEIKSDNSHINKR